MFKKISLIVLILAVVALGFFIFLPHKTSAAGWQEISVQDLTSKMNEDKNLVIVDLREPDLYAQGHIPGSISIPFADFPQEYNKLNPKSDIVLVCHTGPMGETSGQFLVEKGYTKVFNLSGGMEAWSGQRGQLVN